MFSAKKGTFFGKIGCFFQWSQFDRIAEKQRLRRDFGGH